MSGQSRAGWAKIRYTPTGEGCAENEIGGYYRENWWACCPKDQVFDGHGSPHCNKGTIQGNATSQDQCANSTWSMWWSQEYFCCEPDLTGYYWKYGDLAGWVGCWSNDWVLQAQNNDTGVYKANTATNPPASKSTNTGAIAGGVVGGVCGAILIAGILWFLCRRRRQSKPPNDMKTSPTLISTQLPDNAHYERIPVELESQYGRSERKEELPGWTTRHELSGQPPPRELA